MSPLFLYTNATYTVLMAAIDYLLIGHVTQDLTPTGPALGGAVTYGGLTAHALGRRVGVLTSLPENMGAVIAPLRVLDVRRIPAAEFTTFENIYTPAGRIQHLRARAVDLSISALPDGWNNPAILHLAPVANEIPLDWVNKAVSGLRVATPQGWMRQWDAEGRVTYRPWLHAEYVLPRIDAVVMSIEDVLGDENLLRQYAKLVPILAVTRGPAGSTLFIHGMPQHIPAPRVSEIGPTGAGDIFAAAFFICLQTGSDPVRAARFATLLASDSVRREGLASIPPRHMIRAASLECRIDVLTQHTTET